ncbi:hypothetical protein N7465_011883 [Penicillium sp. CMV-2018d]|nr:hypothetical protein N7465_011883 [Penicillium sp. CMV-2018d]
MCHVHRVIARYYTAHQTPPRYALLSLELRLAFLLYEMLRLSAEDAIDRGLEEGIWDYVG